MADDRHALPLESRWQQAAGIEPPPDDPSWTAQLHWAVRSIPTADKDLGFLASLLSHALKNGGLSDKQARYAERALDRIRTGTDAQSPTVPHSPLRTLRNGS